MSRIKWPRLESPEQRMLAYLTWLDMPSRTSSGQRYFCTMPMCADDMRLCRAEARRIGWEANGYVTDAGRAWAAQMLTPYFRLLGLAADGDKIGLRRRAA